MNAICIVRRDEQVQLLKEEYKQERVLNSSSENFDQELKQHIDETGAKVLLECVAGDIGGGILRLMPNHSVLITYGILSKDTLNNIDPMSFMYGQQTIEGFILDKYLLGKGLLGVLKVLNKTKKLITTTLQSEVHGKFEFSQIHEAIEYYEKNMSKGKIILVPELKKETLDE